jgi:methylisocitrate lyase
MIKSLLAKTNPLPIVGVIHAYAAKLAEQAGHQAIYLSGAGVANAQFALPDLALTSLNDVLEQTTKITDATALPLLVDADTGWGSPLNVRRTFRLLSKAGASGAHIEDQTDSKRCGHREGKKLVSTDQMVGRLKAALDGRVREDFMVVARTDALAVEGEQAALARAIAYQEAGADALFVEAATSVEQYKIFTQALKVPVLANMTEFGKTPLMTQAQLKQANVSMILYPLSAFRAMNMAALKVYEVILKEGSQQSMLPAMQTREALYKILGYENFEEEINRYLED